MILTWTRGEFSDSVHRLGSSRNPPLAQVIINDKVWKTTVGNVHYINYTLSYPASNRASLRTQANTECGLSVNKPSVVEGNAGTSKQFMFKKKLHGFWIFERQKRNMILKPRFCKLTIASYRFWLFSGTNRQYGCVATKWYPFPASRNISGLPDPARQNWVVTYMYQGK